MSSNKDLKMGALKPVAQKNDKVEVIKVLVLAVVSFALGFGLVILFLGPDSSKKAEIAEQEEVAPSVAAEAPPVKPVPASDNSGGYAPEGSAGFAPTVPVATGAVTPPVEAVAPPVDGAAPDAVAVAAQEGETGKAALADEATAPAEVPPGKTPENVALDGTAFYVKCWDDKNTEMAGANCDRLSTLEKRFATRLYVVDACRKKLAGEKAEGKLSLGVEVNFTENGISYWNGPSSDIDKAGQIAGCLKSDLRGLPVHSIDHKYAKYRLFFTVLFGKAKKKAPAQDQPVASQPAPAKAAGGGAKGQTMKVTQDRVRVRKTPVDGEIIGKIGTGNEVKLLKKQNGWCQVLTPNNNEGWMTCDALSK